MGVLKSNLLLKDLDMKLDRLMFGTSSENTHLNVL